jgi:uncharacterized damage-inducible protein DinB
MTQREQRTIGPLPASHPELGRWLWALEDTRRRTLEALDGITRDELDWTPPGLANSISTLLYHTALIETDYLCIDILGMDDYFPDLKALLPVPDRNEAGELVAVTGVALQDHLSRLATIRTRFLDRVSSLSPEQMAIPREFPAWNYDISPEWTLHHLMQHEAEHRGEIVTIRTLYKARGSSGLR